MSEGVCRELKNSYDPQFFQTKMTREVSRWCIDFFKQYDTAPQKEIESIYEMKDKAGKIDPDLSEEIERFLTDLSKDYEEWEQFNEQYYIDLGLNYFKKRSFISLSNQIKEAAEANDVEEAEKRYADFTKIQMQLDQSRNVLDDSGIDDLKFSIINRPPYLFEMPGAVGRMIGPIERETFIGLLGREKVGKTYHLMMFAIAAIKKGLNVAMIETGDLTQDQLDTRFYSYFSKKTARLNNVGKKFVPVMDCKLNQTGECEHSVVDRPLIVNNEGKLIFNVNVYDHNILEAHIPCTYCWKDRFKRYKFQGSIWWKKQNIEMWDWPDVRKAVHKFRKRFNPGRLVTEAFPMRTVRASDIRDWCIKKQKQEGFIPDVLIVDYPDIMLPENNRMDHRHQENEKWMILREISQEFHNCVIVGTQADAKAYNRETLQLDNYSEDKRKYSHTTHFYAINKTKTEENFGCSRLSGLLLREDSLQITQQATLIQNLNIANPHVTSFFGKVPGLNKNNKEK